MPFVTAPEQVRGARRARRARASRTARCKTLAASLMKIANDVRWLASGPRCGHRRDHASPRTSRAARSCRARSTPRSAEALTMVCAPGDGQRRRGQHRRRMSGNFELNVFKPLIIHNFLQSCAAARRRLRRASTSTARAGIEPNRERIAQNLEQLADAGDRAQPAHRLRQRGQDRQDGARDAARPCARRRSSSAWSPPSSSTRGSRPRR